MKPREITKLAIIVVGIMIWGIMPGSKAIAEDALKYSCSSQIFSAFSMEEVKAFSQETGIKVKVRPASSGSCVYALMNGHCDVASTARALYRRHRDYGYVQIPFARDPLAVIANKTCGIDSLTADQIQDIFSGDVKNWKEVGGADLPILVIVPGKGTAANKNFRRQFMKLKDIKHDFMAYDSTMVIEAVKHFPCGAVSFISQGAVVNEKSIRTIKIDGLGPLDKGYPYFQIFYYVVKDEPGDQVKKFIDFTFSEKGAAIIKENGMLTVKR